MSMNFRFKNEFIVRVRQLGPEAMSNVYLLSIRAERLHNLDNRLEIQFRAA